MLFLQTRIIDVGNNHVMENSQVLPVSWSCENEWLLSSGNVEQMSMPNKETFGNTHAGSFCSANTADTFPF
jgi:hypothetical protein